MNNVILTGRLVATPEVRHTASGKSTSNIRLAVKRDFANSAGEYETDFINCVLWKGIAENAAKYCQKGDLISIKGRIQNRSYEKDGDTHYITEVIAEKVSFLHTKKSTEEES